MAGALLTPPLMTRARCDLMLFQLHPAL